MVKIREAIVVEGRYDKNTLSQVVDAPILETAGFGIFKDRQQMALLRRVAEKRGLIVFTDSDGAGFVIRNFLKGALPPEQVCFLREALDAEGGPVVILSHHPLVGDPADPHVIRNQAEVQSVIRGARRRVL